MLLSDHRLVQSYWNLVINQHCTTTCLPWKYCTFKHSSRFVLFRSVDRLQLSGKKPRQATAATATAATATAASATATATGDGAPAPAMPHFVLPSPSVTPSRRSASTSATSRPHSVTPSRPPQPSCSTPSPSCSTPSPRECRTLQITCNTTFPDIESRKQNMCEYAFLSNSPCFPFVV